MLVLPQCDFWRFCTTWMASSKGPISGLLVISASADVFVGQRYRVWRQVDALKTVNFSFTISIYLHKYIWSTFVKLQSTEKVKTHNVKVVQAITIHANHYSPATPKTNSNTKYDFKRENTKNNPFQDTTGNQAKNESQTILTSLPLRKNWRPLWPAFLLHLVTFFSSNVFPQSCREFNRGRFLWTALSRLEARRRFKNCAFQFPNINIFA